MFTLYQVDDGELVVRSADPGDIARVFRLLNYDLPVPSGCRITDIYVTIHKQHLTEQNLNTNSTLPQHECSDVQDELPF